MLNIESIASICAIIVAVILVASVITGRQTHELLYRRRSKYTADASKSGDEIPATFMGYLLRPICVATSLVTGLLSASLLVSAVNAGEIQGSASYALILGFTVPFIVTLLFMTFPGGHFKNIGVLVTSAIGCTVIIVLLTRTSSSIDTALGISGTVGLGVFFSPMLAGWIRGD